MTGDAAVLDEVFKGGSLAQVTFSTVLNTHRHGHYFRHALGEVGAGCGMPYNPVRGIVSRLFAEKPECEIKFVALAPQALYAFVINNMHKLKEDFRAAVSADLPANNKANPVAEKEFHFPHTWIMTYDSSLNQQKVYDKNVYKGYLASARPRSTGEVKFEKSYCERHKLLGGFVCYSEDEDELLMTIAGFSENKADPRWRPLEEVMV